MEQGAIGGYLIEHRAVLHPLIEEMRGQGHVSKLELYEYLIVHANYSDIPRRKPVGDFFVMEYKGQVVVSVQTLADFFSKSSKNSEKIQRNTITKKLQSLEKDGFIRFVQNSKNRKNGIAYEIVNYGDPLGTFKKVEQPQTIDYTMEESEFCDSELSNRVSNRIEQPSEQPKTQNFEQPKSIDIYSENGNFSQSVEQPQKESAFKGTMQESEQHILSKYVNKGNIDYTSLNSRTITHEEKIFNSVCKDVSFWNKLKKEYNIKPEEIERKFDLFWKKQLEDNSWHSSKLIFENCFCAWFEALLKKNYGSEIFKTIKGHKTNPVSLKNPMRLLTPMQKKEFAVKAGISQESFLQSLANYLQSGTVDDYRFTDFEEEKDKLFQYIANEPQNLLF